ncbi:YggT family protein [Dryocola sp. BD586]|jgi:YggT family protein|uniref:YggT family protein n=1 Tax=Dryocola sp. BD586 TaxID=3133271 RepID=UPI003F509FD4
MQMLTFLISTVIELYVMVLLLRIWMQWARTDFYNPFSQFVVKATQPVISPLRRVIPSMGPLDTSSLLIAYVLCLVKAMVLFQAVSFAPIIWIAALLVLLKTAGLLFFWVMIIRALMSWVSQGRSPVEFVLMQLTEPFMAPIRRILPAMGGIDFSGMIVILALYALNIGVAELLALSGNMLLPSLWMAL